MPLDHNEKAIPRQNSADQSRDTTTLNSLDIAADQNLPRPKKDKTSAGEQLANMFELPATGASGYFAARHGGLRIAGLASAKLANLSDYAIPENLAVDFGRSRVALTKELEIRYDTALQKVDAMIKTEPHLFEQGCKFEFCNTGISEEMTSKLYRGNNLGEVVGALDKIPVKDLTAAQVKQVGEYAERLGGSPLLKKEGLTHFAAQIQGGADKLAKAMVTPGNTEAATVAENEMYGFIKNLRQEMGSRKLQAEEVVKGIAKERPDLLELGHRFEFDPTVSAEKVAQLRRPGQFNDLLETVKKTHAPESKFLITSQGEHLKALSGLSENALIKGEGLTGIASRLEVNAVKVVESRVKTFELLSREQSTFVKKNLGILGAGMATNYIVDKTLFDNPKPGLLSYAADIGSPLILLTGTSAPVKFAVIIGSHLLARLSEKQPETKKHRR